MNKDLMTEQQLRDQMVTMARSMFERGYATGGAGNLSVKLPNGHFWQRDGLLVWAFSGRRVVCSRYRWQPYLG